MYAQLGRRISVALVGGPIVLLAAWYGGVFFWGAALVITMTSAFEFVKILQKKIEIPSHFLTLVAVVVLFAGVYWGSLEFLLTFLTAYILVLFITELFRDANNVIMNASTALLTFFYVGVLGVFMVAIRELPTIANIDYQAGGVWILTIFLATWICDSAAYFVGSRFGKRKLSPNISPNKTIEGAVGGLFGSLLTTVGVRYLFPEHLGWEQAITLGIIIGLLGQMSDLLESLFKRDAGVKDASAILPGHGGVLDRFDSELLVAPVIYFYLRWSLA